MSSERSADGLPRVTLKLFAVLAPVYEEGTTAQGSGADKD